jgi:peptidoglycan LD-endopeptidase CwlK
MPVLSQHSLEQLSLCHPKLQELVKAVATKFDITVICGARSKEDQDKAFREGRSKAQYPNSPHNKLPSNAVDIAPYPIDWNDVRRFYYLGGFVVSEAKRLGIKIRWGGDWNGNFDIKDQNFHDLPHFELIDGGA